VGDTTPHSMEQIFVFCPNLVKLEVDIAHARRLIRLSM